nr:dihydrolipoyllysine-residue acetyltransferase component 1 of pyruvate dehydrogenase complex, mitochondrial-like isoform X1 [Penaeus vannamei]
MAALRAGFLAQNLYRTHFSKVSRFNYLYAALFHSSPPLNAGLFGFGGDDEGGSFLDNFYEAHSHMAGIDEAVATKKSKIQVETQEKISVPKDTIQMKCSRKTKVEEQHRKQIMRGEVNAAAEETVSEVKQEDEANIINQPWIRDYKQHPKKALKWYEIILMEGHGMAQVKSEPVNEVREAPSSASSVEEGTDSLQVPGKDSFTKERMQYEATANELESTGKTADALSSEKQLPEYLNDTAQSDHTVEQLVALSKTPDVIDEVTGNVEAERDIPLESEFVHHQPELEPKFGPKNIAKLDFAETQIQEREKYLDTEDELTSCQKENLQEIGNIKSMVMMEDDFTLRDSDVFHEYPEERVTTLIVPLVAAETVQSNPVDLSGEHTELQEENLQVFGTAVQEEAQSVEDVFQNVDIHEYSSKELQDTQPENIEGDYTLEQLFALTKTSDGTDDIEGKREGIAFPEDSEFVHHQPALEPTSGPKNIAKLDFADVQKRVMYTDIEDELTSCQKENLQEIGTTETTYLQEDGSGLSESIALHEYPEERVTTLIMPLEAVVTKKSDPVDISGELAELQEENLQAFGSAVQEEPQTLEDPLHGVDIHKYTSIEAESLSQPGENMSRNESQESLSNGDRGTVKQEQDRATPSPTLTPDTCSLYQVPEDTKDVKVGTLIAVLAPEGEDWKTIEIPAGEESAASATTAEDTPAAAAAGGGHAHGNYGPSVRLLLEQYGLAAEQVPPGGPHGILLKGDVLKYIKEKSLQPLPVSAVPPPEVPKPAVAAAPVAPAPTPAVPAPPPTIGVSEDGYEDIEVTSMRRTIAKRLTQSKSGIAHSYGTLECQSDKLLALRKQYKNEGINVSVNDLIIKAVSVALTKCPEMNCVWQGDQLTYASQVDMSIAVATPTGLITPIVRGADFLGIEEIASQVRDLAARARENKLKLDEFQGGTFTISNLGMFGISEFSAIINPPQCGILAVGSGIVKIDENGSPVTCMRATLSYDRAGVDDDTAAAFLEELKNILENPVTMMVGGYKSQVDHPLAALL